MKQCIACSASFDVSGDDRAFIDKLAPIIGGTAIPIPDPTHCPDCRQHRRMAFRNDSNYYKNTCTFCKKNVISIYSPDKEIPVLCHTCFWSDQWDPHSYAADFDFSKSFAEQFDALKHRVPRLCIFNTQSENSDYTVHSSRNRNCYMSSSLVDNEDVYFGDFVFKSSDCIDCFSCEHMQLCYSCVFCEDCYNSDWLHLCFNVTDAMFCFDCKGCTGVLGCVGRRNASNEILNVPVTREEYETTRHRLLVDPEFRKAFRAKVDLLKLTIPVPAMWQISSEGCSGNYLLHCKGVFRGFNIKYFEDCRYAYEGNMITDSCDLMRCASGELLYDCTNIVALIRGAFCNLTYQCDNLLYCDNCHGSSNCFGCFSFKNAQYCILNKQYSKEDYEALVPRIIEHMKGTGEWGEFFPITISSFGYNETKAMQWFPLSKEEVTKRAWQWSDYEQSMPHDIQGIDAAKLPDNIADVPDDILNYIISPVDGGKPFRLIPQELTLYRKKGLPLPRKHPHERMLDLVALQNPRTLYKRECGKCQKEIETTYAPDGPEIVYCEECYLETVY